MKDQFQDKAVLIQETGFSERENYGLETIWIGAKTTGNYTASSQRDFGTHGGKCTSDSRWRWRDCLHKPNALIACLVTIRANLSANTWVLSMLRAKSPEAVANEIIRSLKQAGVWHGEVHNIRKDETSFWCHANVSTFKHPQYGEVWISVNRDITESKRARRHYGNVTSY